MANGGTLDKKIIDSILTGLNSGKPIVVIELAPFGFHFQNLNLFTLMGLLMYCHDTIESDIHNQMAQNLKIVRQQADEKEGNKKEEKEE